MMKQIIEKWYLNLPFPEKYREDFYKLLDTCRLEPCTLEQYLETSHDGQENLLMFLYFCEELYEKYQAYAIEDSVFYDTVEDIVRWTNTYHSVYGKLGLEEINWLKYHMACRIFKLGRLQFEMRENEVGVHIPEGEPLDYERCLQSFAYAKSFFAKHFPAFSYEKFTCHSWLLDAGLIPLLGKNSNIAKFQTLFTMGTCSAGIRNGKPLRRLRPKADLQRDCMRILWQAVCCTRQMACEKKNKKRGNLSCLQKNRFLNN